MQTFDTQLDAEYYKIQNSWHGLCYFNRVPRTSANYVLGMNGEILDQYFLFFKLFGILRKGFGQCMASS
jgi:hypothetical protein